jgi:hypothetical protein
VRIYLKGREILEIVGYLWQASNEEEVVLQMQEIMVEI